MSPLNQCLPNLQNCSMEIAVCVFLQTAKMFLTLNEGKPNQSGYLHLLLVLYVCCWTSASLI